MFWRSRTVSYKINEAKANLPTVMNIVSTSFRNYFLCINEHRHTNMFILNVHLWYFNSKLCSSVSCETSFPFISSTSVYSFLSHPQRQYALHNCIILQFTVRTSYAQHLFYVFVYLIQICVRVFVYYMRNALLKDEVMFVK